MNVEAGYLAAVLLLGLGASFRGWLRLDLAAVLIMLSLVVPWRRGETGTWEPILPAAGAFSGFGSPAVVMIVAIFVLSLALERTGAAHLVGSRLLRASSRT